MPQHGRASASWLDEYFGWIPIFDNDGSASTAARSCSPRLVLAIMILPIVTALSREVFLQAPAGEHEAALALGATRWEMIRTGGAARSARPGIIAAVDARPRPRARRDHRRGAVCSRRRFDINWHITEPGGNTFAANIALQVRRGRRGRPRRADRLRPGAVRHHPASSTWPPGSIIDRRREFSGANCMSDPDHARAPAAATTPQQPHGAAAAALGAARRRRRGRWSRRRRAGARPRRRAARCRTVPRRGPPVRRSSTVVSFAVEGRRAAPSTGWRPR